MSPPAAGAALRARHGEAAPLRLPPAPRRVSGPSRHPRAQTAAPATHASPLLRLIDHPWLERLVRGRAWIAIVATALLGIVAIQVALLRIGAQIGSETSAVNALTAQNETTQTELAVMEASHRLTRAAASLGMVYPAPGAVSYLQAYDGDAARAVRTMTVPSAAALAAAAADRSANRAPSTPPPSTTPVSTPSTGAGAATTTSGTDAPASTTAGTTAAGATTTGAGTTAGTTTAGTTAGTTTSGTTAGTTTSGTTTSGTTTSGTTTSGTTAGTTAAGTAQTPTSGTPATTTPATTTPATTTPATTTAGTATAPATTSAGGTTPGG